MKEEIGTAIAQEGTVSAIYEIIKTYDKTEYGRVIEERADYAVLYHLADVRANVIEWLPIESTDAVCEVNAECGALSSVLLQKAGSLTCLTDTALQKELLEYRLIKEAGRLDAIGRPILFRTTEEFLRCFGVKSTDDLPVVGEEQVEDFKIQAQEEVKYTLDEADQEEEMEEM